MKPGQADTRWFKAQFESHKISLRQLAKRLGIEPSALSHVIHGKRKLQLTEANLMAEILGLKVEELMVHLGIEPHESDQSKSVRVEGWVDGNLNIQFKAPSGPKKAPLPLSLGEGVKALRCQTAGSRFDGIDGALIYFRIQGTSISECIGKLCVLKTPSSSTALSKKGEWKLRVIRRGYGRDVFNLLALNGEVLEEGIAVEEASPVLWMKL